MRINSLLSPWYIVPGGFFCFVWQKGYGAFTYSRSQFQSVARYILTQEEHHETKPFKEEYLEIPGKNNVEFKDEYVFEFFSDINGWD